MSVSVSNFGGVITSFHSPGVNKASVDIALGYDTLAEYEADRRFLGCIVGRYANRIANGKFTLDGKHYQLETNPKGHHLHGGSDGYHKQLWQGSVQQEQGVPVLRLHHCSADGHGGYPGTLDCTVTYHLCDAGDLHINYYASTDTPTVVNLTNHSYFNLAGHHHATENSVLNHRAELFCDSYLPTDNAGIPLSGPVPVAGTPMDFRSAATFADRIDQPFDQLINGNGYDHNWVVNRSDNACALAARITEPVSGRTLEVHTTQPGIQVYTGNNLDGLTGKGGAVYERRGALCLETQHFPDSPNQADFPSTVIIPGRPLHQRTIFRLGLSSENE